jgi:thiol:disulfide interchange protein DsbA
LNHDAGAAILRRRFHLKPRMTARLSVLLALALLWLPALAQHHDHDHGAAEGYELIEDGLRLAPADGRIEVVEVFAYTCGHCANFQPLVDAWLRKLPDDVRFTYLPTAYDPNDAYARSYFAAESLGVLKRIHGEAFIAIHRNQSLPPRGATASEMAAFAAEHGADPDRFLAAMASAETDARMAAARTFAVRNGVYGTPTLVINGKYRVQGRTLSDTLRIADQLIARERAGH